MSEATGLTYVDQEAELYRVALELLRLEKGALGDAANSSNRRIKIDFDVNNLQIKITATLEAEVTPTDNGAEISIKPRAIYDSPQPAQS